MQVRPVQEPTHHTELVDLDALTPQPLKYPPAIPAPLVFIFCVCGKNGTPYAHGLMPGRQRPFTCDEVLAIRCRV
jgi:hypothetical protein